MLWFMIIDKIRFGRFFFQQKFTKIGFAWNLGFRWGNS